MIEYSMYTGDQSHTKTLQDALTANYGPANDFILQHRRGQTGNDDQAFWSLAVMSALEYQFPDPEKAPAGYLDVAINSFNNIMSRWDEDSCGGGLKWQIYPENAYGYNYKNSISNGCAFALGARLARYTGNQTYADWSVKIYDWSKKVGLISDIYEVFDGSDDKTNCEKVGDKTQWTYNNAMFLHGSAFMFDYTKGDNAWKERTEGFLKHAELLFFKPFENATDVMYEWACETGETGRHCNLDQQSFKAYLSRFMAKTALMAPFTKDTITKYLKASAVGAAKSCSGAADSCGSKWYTGNWDGTSGVGQQLSALEVTQSLLMLKKGIMPVKKGETKPEPSATATPKASSTPAATPAPAPSSHTAPLASSQTSSPASSSQAPPPMSSIQAPPAAPSSQAPPPASSIQASTPASSSAAPSSTPVAPASSSVAAVPMPASSASSHSPAPPAPVLPSASTIANATSSAIVVKPSSTSCSKSGGSCSCTPSVTKTIYVPPVSQTPPPAVPILSTSTASAAPPAISANGTVPVPSATPIPSQFEGTATNMKVTGVSILIAAAVAVAAGLL